MKINIQQILLWGLLPLLNFLIWMYFGQTWSNSFREIRAKTCKNTLDKLLRESLLELQEEEACESKLSDHCSPRVQNVKDKFGVEWVNTVEFDRYRYETMGSNYVTEIPFYPEDMDTVIFKPDMKRDCKIMKHQFVAWHDYSCLAVAYVQGTKAAYNVVRFDDDVNVYGLKISDPDPSQIDKYSKKYPLNVHNEGRMTTAGYFRKVPKDNGRERVRDKLMPFLENFDDIQNTLTDKLDENDITEGSDLVVMVVNEGEIDLFLNFACSCRQHDISLNNVIVFAGSSEIIPLIESTGAMGLYHEGYASVSRKPSFDYLDRVFVDMMWYKAFSVYLILRRRINILFQDADMVWFKDPMAYFHAYAKTRKNLGGGRVEIEAFFSDDGQRSMRYTPFFANSGFYYMKATERTEYFAWSIMAAFDSVQVLGSHQNVITTKLVDGLALSHPHIKLLSLFEFPNGIMYHHDLAYMKRLADKEVEPYHFHMCWTQGKPDKLKYLNKVKMWYLTDTCSPLEALIMDSKLAEFETEGEWRRSKKRRRHHSKPGPVYTYTLRHKSRSKEERWNGLGDMCCTSMDGAP